MIEFRHKEWIRESVFEGLEKRKAGIVFCDMPMCHLAQTSIISTHANDTKRRTLRGNLQMAAPVIVMTIQKMSWLSLFL